jgi:hypothetical protein
VVAAQGGVALARGETRWCGRCKRAGRGERLSLGRRARWMSGAGRWRGAAMRGSCVELVGWRCDRGKGARSFDEMITIDYGGGRR